MKLFWLPICLVALTLTGCGAFADYDSVDSGSRINRVASTNLKPGTDTRAEVLAELGTPFTEYSDKGVVVYLWHKVSGSYHLVGPKEPTLGKYEALALKFDDRQILQRQESFVGRDWSEVRERILVWAQ
jgi:outer membrane protein assembly factor BamE (lipoprotein component of BamABCDE complex)